MTDTSELRQLQQQLGLPMQEPASLAPDGSEQLDLRTIKRTIGRLHDVLRDSDSQSNIVSRFDEITKLMFAKVMADRMLSASDSPFTAGTGISATKARSYYHALAVEHSSIVPPQFNSLKCSDAAISQCVEVLRLVQFSSAKFDFKGMAYEEIIRNTFDKADHQQFFTPPHLVDFIVEMCGPIIRGDVCDPAAGTGGFLASIARHGYDYDSLTALEIDERLTWVAGVNMFLHDANNVRTITLQNGGTLGSAGIRFYGSFDTIITNPPFGSDFNDRIALDSMTLGTGRVSRRRGILFIERCHRLLREHGTLAIIIDEGVLNLPHAADVRQFITSNFDVKAIINLPETAFMPYASVNTSILILRKYSDSCKNRAVFFAKAEAVGRKPSGDEDIRYYQDGKPYLHSDLPAILSLWHKHLRGIHLDNPDLAYEADITENLAAHENGNRIDFQFHHPARFVSEKLLRICPFPLAKLGDICVERTATIVPSRELDSTILYTGLAHIESRTGAAWQVPTPANSLKSGVKPYESGDILFARMRPNLRKVALMDFPEGGYASPECAVLVVRPDESGHPVVDPLLLSVLLRSDFVYGQIMHLIAGIGRPRISSTELRQVMIPILPQDTQSALRAEFLRRRERARELRSQSTSLNIEADSVSLNAVGYVADRFSGKRVE